MLHMKTISFVCVCVHIDRMVLQASGCSLGLCLSGSLYHIVFLISFFGEGRREVW